MSYFANYIPERQCLVLIVRKGRTCDLALPLKQYNIREISIDGTPSNVAAIGEYPQIEVVGIDHYERPDLNDFRGLTKLKRLSVGFGHLASIELDFCSATLEQLTFFKLSRVKDLSCLTQTSMPRLSYLRIDSMRNYVPPDFLMFPNLLWLMVKNTNWTSLKWLSKLKSLEFVSIWGNKVADNDWRPLVELPQLKELHGMHTVFRVADRKEFARLRPDVKFV